MEDDLTAVETLLQQAQDAPKYGVNSREFVLRAARAAVRGPAASHSTAPSTSGQPCKGGTLPDKQQGGHACSGEAAEQLVQSLTVHERPLVQYIARSAVPRIARQGVANRLAGLHLAYLLQRAGLPVSAAGLQHPDAAPIRKAGVAAGLAQELSLYRKSNSKLVYMNAAARTPACPSFLPAAAEVEEVAALAAKPSPQEGAGGGEHANKRQRVDDDQPAAQQEEEAQEEGGGRDKGSAETGSTGHVAPCVELVEDAIPWDAANLEGAAGDSGGSPPSSDREDALNASNAESHSLEDTAGAGAAHASDEQERERPPSRAKRRAEDSAVLLCASSPEAPGLRAVELMGANGSGNVLSGRQSREEASRVQLQPDSRGQEEYSPSNSLDVQELDFLTAGALDGAPDINSLPQQRENSALEPEADRNGVRRATLRFVRAILDPLYQAKVISRDVYRKVLERAAEKIVTLHADAPNASFLVDEAGKIQRLVSEYVQHVQGHDVVVRRTGIS